jgi:putative tryptophan/tyrosine transport system substrate-binding protein
MIARRQFVQMLGAATLVAPLGSFAQSPGKVPRLGYLISEKLSAETSRVAALRKGLREYGYIEGKNITIEIRTADGRYDRLPELAAELTGLKVDVLVAFGTKALTALMRATTTIPIVDPVMGDPAALGISGSLARPEGNITGSAQFSPESYAKRLEFLKEAAPRITRAALLVNPANASSQPQLQDVRVTANALNLELLVLETRNAEEIREALAAMAQRRIDAVVVSSDTLFRASAGTIIELAVKQRIPVAGTMEFGVAGGLIGYGVDPAELYRRGAYFIDRLLRGAKPADLPIERATKLFLVINLRTAKQLGITVPQSLLLRADDVIRQ